MISNLLNRHQYFIVAFIGIIAALLNLKFNQNITNIYHPKYPGYDSVLYMRIAKSLATGNGYKNIYTEHGIKSSPNCPPLYPLILSPIVKFSTNKYVTSVAITILHFLIYVISIIFVFKISKALLLNNLNSFLVAILFMLNHLVLYYFFVILTEGPFFLFFATSVYMFISYQKFNSATHFYWALFFAALASYTRVYGIVLLFSILFSCGSILKITKEKLISLLAFIPLVSFFFYWWLFTGTFGSYLEKESFFANKSISYLKLTVAEFVFYIPFKILFYQAGVSALDFFYKPIIFLGETTRLDWAGVTSLLIWTITSIYIIKTAQTISFFILLLFIFSILIYIGHTCSACSDPRILLPLLPFLTISIFKYLDGIKTMWLKHATTFTFVLLYLIINVYVITTIGGL